MARDRNMRVKLVLEGPLADILDVVGMCMAGNLMKHYEVDEETVHVRNVDDFFHTSNRVKRDFEVGDYVKVNGASQRYNVEGGEQGTITKVYFTGERSKVKVRWDDNSESDIGGSMLQIVRTVRKEQNRK